MDIIKKGLKKSKDTSNGTLDTTIISDLTSSTGTSNSSDAPALIPPPLCIGFVNADKPIGRPKGTTLKASREKLERVEAMMNSIAVEWKDKVTESTGRMPNKELDKLIEKKQEEFNLKEVPVNKSLVRQRIRKNRIVCLKHSGTPTPIAPVESYIVGVIQSMSRLRQPLNVSQGLSLANSLIEGTQWEDIAIEFKKKRGWNPFTSDGEKKTSVRESMVSWVLEEKQTLTGKKKRTEVCQGTS